MSSRALVAVLVTISIGMPIGHVFAEPRPRITRKAVLVGIDRYQGTAARPINPLHGAVADALGMADVLKRSFGFDDARLVLDQDGTRAGILSAIRDLAKDARPGDVRVFFFSGHGGYVRNDASPEPDKLDETIVPFDVAAGAADLRDKELAVEFNKVIARGVVLTVILDSCHSGSAVRGAGGVPQGAQAKSAGIDPHAISDAAIPSPPELQGALILSAAQDIEQALELGGPKPHGALTRALLDVLREAGATTEPAYRIFLRAKQAMKPATPQTPVLAGTQQRQRATLFDATPATVTAKTEVAVTYKDGQYVVEAGQDLGLGVGSILGKRDAGGVVRAKLEVTELQGLSRATAQVRGGDASAVEGGGRFEVLEWSAVPGTNLLIDLGDQASSPADLEQARADLEAVKAKPGVVWMKEPTGWTHWLEWERTASGSMWVLYGPTEARRLTRSELRAWRPSAGKTVRLFGVLPPVRSLVEVLGARWSKPGGWVTVAASRAEAHYRLIGQPGPSGPEYSLVRAARMTGQVGALPLRTDRYSSAQAEGGPAAAAAELNEAAQRLARAYAWIVLRSPPLSDAKFPYRLALRGRNGIVKHDGDVVVKNETYGLSLTADPGALGDRVQPRWVYVFAMDSHGRRQLVFPRSGFGDVENRIPVGKEALPEVVLTESTFTVAPPFGRDSFFMLATENKLPDPEALNEDGVRTRGLRGAGGDALPVDLLLPVTQRTRGFAVVPLPADWTLQRIEVNSVEASK